jgi:hypothetical protein
MFIFKKLIEMKKASHFIWFFCSLLAYAGKELPEKLPLKQDATALEESSAANENEGEKPVIQTTENTGEKPESAAPSSSQNKNGYFASLVKSPNLISHMSSFLSLSDIVNLACVNSQICHKIKNMSCEKSSVSDLKDLSQKGEVELFLDALSLENHLYYPEEISNFYHADKMKAPFPQRKKNFLNGVLFSDKSIAGRALSKNPLVLFLRKSECKYLEDKQNLLEKQENEKLEKAGALEQPELQKKCKNWKQVIKEKNIPLIISDELNYCLDPDLSSQIVRLIPDIHSEKYRERAFNWAPILEAVEKNNIQLTAQFMTRGSEAPLFIPEALNAIRLMFQTGKVSELRCFSSLLKFREENWATLMSNRTDQVRSFVYADDDREADDVSVFEFLNYLSQKMPRLKKLVVSKALLKNEEGSLGRGSFAALKDLTLFIPNLAEEDLVKLCTMFPRGIKSLSFANEAEMGYSDEISAVSVPQALCLVNHFEDLQHFNMMLLSDTCPAVLFSDFMDALAKHRNLKKLSLKIENPNILGALAEKISLFPNLNELFLFSELTETGFLHCESMQNLLQSLASLPSLKRIAFAYDDWESDPQFISRTLSSLPQRMSVAFFDPDYDEDFPMYKSLFGRTLGLEDLREIAASNPSALTRVRLSQDKGVPSGSIHSHAVDLKTYLEQNKYRDHSLDPADRYDR